MSCAIEIKELTKKYKELTAVDSLSLKIEAGELFALLGVNGAGKTTTVKMLSCLAKPTYGDALICGKSIVKEPKAVKQLIGVSPQETAVAPLLTVRENLMMMCGVYGINKNKAKEKTREILTEFSLGDVSERKAGKLSGGWQRRLSIALACVGEPQILFLDEPTLGLDVIARSELWDTVRSLKGKVTIILTTHYMEEAEALSDKIGIMRDGKLLTVGTAEQIKSITGKEKFEDAFISVIKGEFK